MCAIVYVWQQQQQQKVDTLNGAYVVVESSSKKLGELHTAKKSERENVMNSHI